MTYYSIKPFNLIMFEYIGGPNFNIQIYNEYAVESNYSLNLKLDEALGLGKNFFELSDYEVDKLRGSLDFNGYNSGLGLYDMVLHKRHLVQDDQYKVNKFYCFYTLSRAYDDSCIILGTCN